MSTRMALTSFLPVAVKQARNFALSRVVIRTD